MEDVRDIEGIWDLSDPELDEIYVKMSADIFDCIKLLEKHGESVDIASFSRGFVCGLIRAAALAEEAGIFLPGMATAKKETIN